MPKGLEGDCSRTVAMFGHEAISSEMAKKRWTAEDRRGGGGFTKKRTKFNPHLRIPETTFACDDRKSCCYFLLSYINTVDTYLTYLGTYLPT